MEKKPSLRNWPALFPFRRTLASKVERLTVGETLRNTVGGGGGGGGG